MKTRIPEPPARLPERQKRFYYYYLETLNATQAAIRAGYAPNNADKNSSKWVGKNREKCPKAYWPLFDAIKAVRTTEIKKIGLTSGWLLEKWMEIAGFCIQDIVDPETGKLIPIQDLPPEVAAGIEGIKLQKETSSVDVSGEGDVSVTKTEVIDIRTVPTSSRIKALEFLSKFKRLDPTLDYKQGGQGGTGEAGEINKVLQNIAGKTRGLPAKTLEIPQFTGE